MLIMNGVLKLNFYVEKCPALGWLFYQSLSSAAKERRGKRKRISNKGEPRLEGLHAGPRLAADMAWAHQRPPPLLEV